MKLNIYMTAVSYVEHYNIFHFAYDSKACAKNK